MINLFLSVFEVPVCARDLRSDAERCAQQFSLTPTCACVYTFLTWAKTTELIAFFLVMYTHSLNNSTFSFFQKEVLAFTDLCSEH